MPSQNAGTRALAARLWAGLLLVAPAASATSDLPARLPPAPPDAADPLALHAALGGAALDLVEGQERILTFAPDRRERPGEIWLQAASVGVLPHPPERVRELLAATSEMREWLPLNPNYKAVLLAGSARVRCEVGSSSRRKARDVLTYAVESDETGVTWRLLSATSPLLPGSSVRFQVAPHPTRPGESLVSHVQVTGLPERGRLTRYLLSDDDNGRNRFWKDSLKHARRTHWALDAALSHPPGEGRAAAYLDHYAREFGASRPYWAR